MPIPTGDFIKTVYGGSIGGAEDWSIGIWARLTGLSSVPTPTQANAYAAFQCAAFASQIWSASSIPLKGANSPDTTFASAKTYFYRGGTLAELGTATITPVVGTSSTFVPAYVALVATLLTGSAGRSRRGRVYLPITGASIASATSQMSVPAQVTGICNNLAVFIGTATATTLPGSPTVTAVVMSQHTTSTTDVKTVRVDSLPDTQHGRSRKLVAVTIASTAV